MIYPIRLKQLAKIGLVFSVILLWGCNESSDDERYSNLWDKEFSSCGVSCHLPSATDGTENGPDLSTKALFYANTVNKTVATDYSSWIRTGDCDSVKLIDPGSANDSLVVGSLVLSVADAISSNFQNSNGQSCTNAFGVHETLSVTLSDQQTIDDLIVWINDGAPEK